MFRETRTSVAAGLAGVPEEPFSGNSPARISLASSRPLAPALARLRYPPRGGGRLGKPSRHCPEFPSVTSRLGPWHAQGDPRLAPCSGGCDRESASERGEARRQRDRRGQTGGDGQTDRWGRRWTGGDGQSGMGRRGRRRTGGDRQAGRDRWRRRRTAASPPRCFLCHPLRQPGREPVQTERPEGALWRPGHLSLHRGQGPSFPEC